MLFFFLLSWIAIVYILENASFLSHFKAQQPSPYRSSGSFESGLLEVLSLVVGVQGNVLGFRTGKVT